MRIVKMTCLGVTLLALSELPVAALDKGTTTESTKSNSFSTKSEFVAQNRWESTAALLIAQNENPSKVENQPVADNSWSSDSEQETTSEPADVLFGLQQLQSRDFAPSRGAPSFTLANPSGFGADRGNAYIGFGYNPVSKQSRVAGESEGDAIAGIGIGLGDSSKAVGLELNYTLASFGFNRDFGTGTFSAKLHRSLAPGWGVAVGYLGFLNTGDFNDFEDSAYLSTTKVFATRERLDSAFSRMALTVGVGNGVFRTEDAFTNDEDQFNPFASLAFRIARPVSAIVEWTGADLAVATSVAPFKTIPVTFNVGLRDIAGAGDGARFVFGVGAGF